MNDDDHPDETTKVLSLRYLREAGKEDRLQMLVQHTTITCSSVFTYEEWETVPIIQEY
jgi:hypothetical protein